MQNSTLIFANPSTEAQIATRNSMLASSLRDSSYSWDYGSEYPLVLSSANASQSWCAYDNDDIVAHANLWPRTLEHSSGAKQFEIGLVGNVATHPQFRNRGHMKNLMEHVVKVAQSQNLQALVLWSDLLQFYQNFCFRSIGQEFRYHIIRNERPRNTGIEQVNISQLSECVLESMLHLRPKLEWTTLRSPQEFRTLLNIPDMHLFARRKGNKLSSWLVIGKGADMRGVIHEWGAISADELLADIQSILHEKNIPELILLAPTNLHHHWISPLNLRCASKSVHPMALAMPLGSHGHEALQALAKGFIWGLDSI
jgi:GNAT superfamily N-acetyltransferase